MKKHTKPMTGQDIRVRADDAHEFLLAAQLIFDHSADTGMKHRGKSVGSLAVLAGIAASDAICGRALGKCAAGEAHEEAVKLLATATVNGPVYARDLRRLLRSKTNVQYSPIVVGEGRNTELVKYARRLVDGLDKELG